MYNPAVSLSRGVFTYTLTNTLFHQVIIVRKRPPLSFPQLLVCISLLCALTGALTLVASHTSPDRRFEQFTSQLFQEEMTGSTLNMHYTIADPKAFGISEYEPVLPIYHSYQPEDSKEHCSDFPRKMPILTGYCIALWKMIWLWQIFLITMSLCHLPPECSPSFPFCWRNTPSAQNGMSRITWLSWIR